MAQQSCGEQREKKKNKKRTLKEGKKVAWKAKDWWDKRWDGCQKMWKVNRKVTVLLCHRSGSKKWKTGSGCERRIRQWERSWPRGLMDKAPASGAGDCGFESRRGRDAFKFLFFSCHAKPRDRISSLYLFSKKKALFWFLLVWGNKSNFVFVPVSPYIIRNAKKHATHLTKAACFVGCRRSTHAQASDLAYECELKCRTKKFGTFPGARARVDVATNSYERFYSVDEWTVFNQGEKMAAACPRWYNAALTHTKWMGNPSSPTLSSNCEKRRACFCQMSPGMHV